MYKKNTKGAPMRTIFFCCLFTLSIPTLPARAALITAGPADDVEVVINALAPGDELVLEAGTYTLTERFSFACILTYAALGNGPANVIERNLLWGCGDHGIQSAADAIIRNNIILGAVGTGIALQPHQSGAPGNQVVVHNTVFNRDGDALAVRNATGDVVVANNAVYAEGGFAIRVVGSDYTLVIAGNVGTGGLDGSAQPGLAAGDLALDFVDAHLDDALPLDCFPLADGALVGAADTDHLAPDDFNGTARAGSADVGAYRFDDGGNPGWTLADGFKDATPVSAPVCGDGALDDDEDCDDGNVVDGDGCSALCRAEGSDEKPASDDGCGCSHAGGRGPVAPFPMLLPLVMLWFVTRSRSTATDSDR